MQWIPYQLKIEIVRSADYISSIYVVVTSGAIEFIIEVPERFVVKPSIATTNKHSY